jgi:hypothetical protein
MLGGSYWLIKAITKANFDRDIEKLRERNAKDRAGKPDRLKAIKSK